MIDFDEELRKFHPSKELEDAENAIRALDMTDVVDLIVMLEEQSKYQQQQ
ncbi:MAG: hypothetical protein K6G03_06510 [Lachnospiraceae bacterium]|nr:hypothetical protein [Lachnospiraceae bacterium]